MDRRHATSVSRSGPGSLRQVRWWVFLLLGLALGWLLHEFGAGQVRDLGPLPVDLVVGMADAGQYLLPLFCAVLAGLSVQRAAPPAPARRAPRVDVALDFHAIEPLLRVALSQRGFTPTHDEEAIVPRDADPADVPDVRVRRHDGEIFLVRWRHLADARVGASGLQDLIEAMKRAGARGAFIVTSGGFTREACNLVRDRELHLVDGVRLMRWIEGVRGARPEAGSVHDSLRRTGPAAGADVATAVAVAARNGRGGQSSGPVTRMQLPAALARTATIRRAL